MNSLQGDRCYTLPSCLFTCFRFFFCAVLVLVSLLIRSSGCSSDDSEDLNVDLLLPSGNSRLSAHISPAASTIRQSVAADWDDLASDEGSSAGPSPVKAPSALSNMVERWMPVFVNACPQDGRNAGSRMSAGRFFTFLRDRAILGGGLDLC